MRTRLSLDIAVRPFVDGDSGVTEPGGDPAAGVHVDVHVIVELDWSELGADRDPEAIPQLQVGGAGGHRLLNLRLAVVAAVAGDVVAALYGWVGVVVAVLADPDPRAVVEDATDVLDLKQVLQRSGKHLLLEGDEADRVPRPGRLADGDSVSGSQALVPDQDRRLDPLVASLDDHASGTPTLLGVHAGLLETSPADVFEALDADVVLVLVDLGGHSCGRCGHYDHTCHHHASSAEHCSYSDVLGHEILLPVRFRPI
jgi:hypothetical protein